jgi:NAD-dependent DNA ligase
MCPERCIARVTNFLAKMNIKDFSDSTIRALGIRTVGELFRVDLQRAQEILGKVNGQKFIDRIEHLKNYPYPDYRFIGSIGFTNIAIATWKTILENYEFDRLLEMHIDEIQYLKNINGIGPKSVDTIINELPFFIEDLKLIRSICNIQMTPIVTDRKKKPQIVFTGFRDPSVEEKLESMGYEIKNNVTKDTMFLVVPYIGFRSTKVDKVFKMLGEKMGKLKGTAPEIIDYNHIPMGVYPTVIDQSIVEDAILKVTSSET